MASDKPPDIDNLIKRMRRAAELSNDAAVSAVARMPIGQDNGSRASRPTSDLTLTQHKFEPDGPLRLTDFLDLHDEEFIRAAYQHILRRGADPRGLDHHLGLLRTGTRKLTILGALRYSPEGEKASVTVAGLASAYRVDRLFRLPIIGHLLQSINILLRLPSVLANTEKHEAHTNLRISQIQQAYEREYTARSELQRHIGRMALTKADRQALTDLNEQVSVVEATKADKAQLASLASGLHTALATKAEEGRVGQALKLVEDEVLKIKNNIQQNQQSLREQQWRLSVFLELARQRLPAPFTHSELAEMQDHDEQALDSLYVAFEERFRGSRNDVKEGMRVYLPHIDEARKRAGNCPVLDVACGRGEWLELLREEGYQAKGVDLNRIMVEGCQERSLDVCQADALSYLHKIPPQTYCAVTSFHFIEHLEWPHLVTLLDEMLRILKPGGVAILETPNARNILVTSIDFYRDPTHKRPIFPETLEAVAELRGFAMSTAYIFDANRSALSPLGEHSFTDLNAYINISRDAAWIGTKR